MLSATRGSLGDAHGALDLLLSIPYLENYQRDSTSRAKSIREQMIYFGYEEGFASNYAASKENETSHILSAIINNGLSVALKQMDSNSEEARIEIASKVANVVQGLNPYFDQFEINALVALNLEKIALQKVNPSTEYGDAGETVQSRLIEINAKFREAKAISMEVEDALTKNSDFLSGFQQRRIDKGAPAAISWLRQQVATRSGAH